ncbi:bifunctional tRNA (5-methylaminomethyl-2-thiouridine)(34)-methyltransferase MnmD/FAD-dependent 5-carboxymethylaminomethyl-2-thiouridine(34) oxidoreductase MnmC [Leptospira langatensis]|uniref:tRNA 5-methylaminomethyl-2-thiouridine biosynthesis bifunctional protein MnmC n=1 Tax=Leptospira langatensis TaxID=2484983 RepID=A0A5F1ZUN9_9LEPT|nr:bifunctional tRNA (5-methylaminomethyl-2-thiouridine)(34)-methyltransferase MnmD/FAD-dependent 5-carboxymethylaminomethyl-2-thiouridine(34) oxidoreductase MnmC [Leptospira langatensis]TGJ98790.1 bifunctional tRNA (5-methylaminomethyl-2-thiouridine)(34)-methyltransferase MnmD/FAD-dependent 5-carboxymethylaminomethyl-2-thiouridine(34) oxidoreductase MnmC [Leptospira langatensis]TGL40643.1 bifunctional tRNA (5-methylaminomethyl-2-thiouridine)(34)-methyltransferase MnmD/FAD-dependent 5-carboxymeth
MIDWKENGTPVSSQFDDIYFSPENGLEETRHVFLNGNRLEERWTSIPQNHSHFSILELGFGTGLNFLATWQLWKRLREGSDLSVLRFVSYELYPLEIHEIQRAIQVFPELSETLDLFLEKYKLLVPGCNSFVFEKERLVLDLWIGDARELLPETSGKFDAFFLDGFAPSKNPELWEENIGIQIGRLANRNSTLATFTVARAAKESLTKAGFTLNKEKGFGRKREMLTGSFGSELFPEKNPLPFLQRNFATDKPKRVLIVGGGLAGAAAARALAWRNIQVEVWDEESELKASSIPNAVSHPHLTKYPTPTSLWTLRTLGHSLRRYPDLLDKDSYSISGTIQLAGEDLPWDRLESGIKNHSISQEIARELAVGSEEIEKNFPKNSQCVFYPSGFWTNTPDLVESIFQHPNILLKKGKVSRISKESGAWVLLDPLDQPLAKGDALVLANSFGIESLLSTLWKTIPFSLTKVRGQLEVLEDPNITPEDPPVRVAEKYLTPNVKGKRVLGSTFDEFYLDPHPREKDREELLEYAKKTFLGIDWAKIRVEKEFVGLRSQTKDRFPILGPIHEPKSFEKAYSGIGLPKNQKKEFPFLEPEKNLYVFGGLGSRGVLTSLLGGEILAAILLGEPLPIENSLYSSLSPARFLYRKIRNLEPKGEI